MPTKLGGDRDVLARSMSFEFREPVYTGERIICSVTYERVVEREDRYELLWEVVCRNDAGDAVLDATVDGLIWEET